MYLPIRRKLWPCTVQFMAHMPPVSEPFILLQVNIFVLNSTSRTPLHPELSPQKLRRIGCLTLECQTKRDQRSEVVYKILHALLDTGISWKNDKNILEAGDWKSCLRRLNSICQFELVIPISCSVDPENTDHCLMRLW